MILYGRQAQARRQAEAVTVMAMTLTQGGPCTNEIKESERSGRFDRKRAAPFTHCPVCSLSAVVFVMSWNALSLLSYAVRQSAVVVPRRGGGLFAALSPLSVIAPHNGALGPM